MTESDLERLFSRAARRMKMQTALQVAILILGLSVLATAGLLFWLRMQGGTQMLLGAVASLPILALLGLIVAFARTRPAMETVALTLDRRAGTHEQLVTWLEFRSNSIKRINQTPADDSMHASFRAAQCAATLRAATAVDPAKLISISLPEWSRAVWLAVVILSCAMLMPPQPPANKSSASSSHAWQADVLKAAAGSTGETLNQPQSAPQVQVISPTDLRKAQLMATDAELPKTLKMEALKDLQSKIGVVPESELAPEVREVLDLLRKETGAARVAAQEKKTGEGADGAAMKKSTDADSPPTENGGAIDPGKFTEKALTTITQHFSDVQDKLERYYKAERDSKKHE